MPTTHKPHGSFHKPCIPSGLQPTASPFAHKTLFPEALDILELTGRLKAAQVSRAGSRSEAILQHFTRLCDPLMPQQVAWVEAVLADVGYILSDAGGQPPANP